MPKGYSKTIPDFCGGNEPITVESGQKTILVWTSDGSLLIVYPDEVDALAEALKEAKEYLKNLEEKDEQKT